MFPFKYSLPQAAFATGYPGAFRIVFEVAGTDTSAQAAGLSRSLRIVFEVA